MYILGTSWHHGRAWPDRAQGKNCCFKNFLNNKFTFRDSEAREGGGEAKDFLVPRATQANPVHLVQWDSQASMALRVREASQENLDKWASPAKTESLVRLGKEVLRAKADRRAPSVNLGSSDLLGPMGRPGLWASLGLLALLGCQEKQGDLETRAKRVRQDHLGQGERREYLGSLVYPDSLANAACPDFL